MKGKCGYPKKIKNEKRINITSIHTKETSTILKRHRICKYFGPRRFGDTTSYRLSLQTL